MTTLVTGGSGFIGSAIVRRLVDAGSQVIVFDDMSRGNSRNLEGYLDKVDIVSGDVRDKGALQEAFKSVETVMHLAYVNGTSNFYEKPDQVIEVGLKGLLNIVDLSIGHGVEKLFLASSSEVYQHPHIIPTPEKIPLIVPDAQNSRFTYGGGKIIYELYGQHFAKKYIDRVIIFRPHNVYGPRMGMEHVIPQLIKKIHTAKMNGSSVELLGDGNQTRSFNYIDDFVDAIELLNAKDFSGVVNIGSSDEIKIYELYKKIARLMQYESEPEFLPSPAGETLRRCPDITLVRGLGYEPRVTLDIGLEKTVDAYLRTFEED